MFFCNKENGVYVLLCNKEEDVFIFFRIKSPAAARKVPFSIRNALKSQKQEPLFGLGSVRAFGMASFSSQNKKADRFWTSFGG